MLLEAARVGAAALAADLAALAEARDPLRGKGARAPADLALRLAALRDPAAVEAEQAVVVDRAAIAALRVEARRLRSLAPGVPGPGLSPGAALSLAYPDRIGQRRPGPEPRYLLSGGKGAHLAPEDPLAAAPLLVAADLDGDPRDAAIRLALPVAESDLRILHAGRLRRETICEWSRRDRAVVARERLMLGALVLEDRPWPDVPRERVIAAMIEGIRDLGLEALPWTPAARRFAARVSWLRENGAPDLPDFRPDALLAGLDDWLGPQLAGISRAADLSGIDLLAALSGRLDHAARHRLDRLAPATITAPTGTDAAGGLFRRRAAGVGAASGDVRPDPPPDARSARGAAGDRASLAGAASGADDRRSPRLLGELLCRGPPRSARPLPQASLAGGSRRRRAHPPRQAAGVSPMSPINRKDLCL